MRPLSVPHNHLGALHDVLLGNQVATLLIIIYGALLFIMAHRTLILAFQQPFLLHFDLFWPSCDGLSFTLVAIWWACH